MIPLNRAPVILRHPDPFDLAVVEDIKNHAVEAYPNESCGFVVPDVGYIRCDNTHPEPDKYFRVDPNDTAQALQRGATAFVHSHPNGPNYPSFADQQGQIDSELIWGIVPVIGTNVEEDIVPVPSDILWWGDKLPPQPLEKRKFIWGIFHCYQLYRDWAKLEWGVSIPNFACEIDFVDERYDIFVDNCERAGLRNLGKIDMSELEVGDMLVGHLRGDIPNHCGIYLGGDDFLHHPTGGASAKTNLLRWWPHIDTVMRYDGPKTTPLRDTG